MFLSSVLFHGLLLLSHSATICFHANSASERAVELAMYDYAHFTETLLQHKAIILFPNSPEVTSGLRLHSFADRFPVYIYEAARFGGWAEMMNVATNLNCDFLYIAKSGLQTSPPVFVSSNYNVRYGIHAVFVWEPHDDLHAAVSRSIADIKNDSPILPCIVKEKNNSIEGNLRNTLGIPNDSMVICRHGGADTFDIDFVKTGIFELLSKHSKGQLYFLFLGTHSFAETKVHAMQDGKSWVEHAYSPFVKFLEKTIDDDFRELFFNTCDAMIHARLAGETFGMAVAEFSVRGKPVITYPGVNFQEHVRILGNKAFLYTNKDQLKQHIERFLESGIPPGDYNAYRDFAPEKVMQAFKTIFLDPALGQRNSSVVEL